MRDQDYNLRYRNHDQSTNNPRTTRDTRLNQRDVDYQYYRRDQADGLDQGRNNARPQGNDNRSYYDQGRNANQNQRTSNQNQGRNSNQNQRPSNQNQGRNSNQRLSDPNQGREERNTGTMAGYIPKYGEESVPRYASNPNPDGGRRGRTRSGEGNGNQERGRDNYAQNDHRAYHPQDENRGYNSQDENRGYNSQDANRGYRNEARYDDRQDDRNFLEKSNDYLERGTDSSSRDMDRSSQNQRKSQRPSHNDDDAIIDRSNMGREIDQYEQERMNYGRGYDAQKEHRLQRDTEYATRQMPLKQGGDDRDSKPRTYREERRREEY